MNYPKYIYVASADPMHNSHLNTKKVAEKLLGKKISLVICRNELKDEGLFSLEERVKIANAYLGDEKVYFASSTEEIREFLLHAQKVVRGVRDLEDMVYIKKLAEYYKVEDLLDKLEIIAVPKELSNVSSTKIKKLVKDGHFLDADEMVRPETLELLKKKFFSPVSSN